MKNIFSLLVKLVLVGLILTGCNSQKGKEDSQAPSSADKNISAVQIITAEKTKISEKIELNGSVISDKVVKITARIEGQVDSVFAAEGDEITAGQLIIKIAEKSSIKTLIASTHEALQNEIKNLERVRNLYEKDFATDEDLEKALTAKKKAELQYYQALEQQEYLSVTAPWNGIISELYVEEGDITASRMQLFEMYDPEGMQIRAAIPEQFATRLQPEMPIETKLDAFPGQIFRGKIKRTFPYLEENTRTRTVDIEVAETLQLLPGMFARLTLTLNKVHNTIVIPSEAIINTPKGPVVFEVVDGKAMQRPVKTGIQEAQKIQILAGIEPGAKIVIAGNENLKSGKPVKILEAKSQQKNNSKQNPQSNSINKGDNQ